MITITMSYWLKCWTVEIWHQVKSQTVKQSLSQIHTFQDVTFERQSPCQTNQGEPSSRWIMAKPRRERCRLPSKGWSKWTKAVVPPYYTVGKNLQRRRPNQVGFIWSSIRKAFPDLARNCGIYEWGVKRPLLGQTKIRVVYVGSTCRDKPGSLRSRILNYCRNGSHKKDLINDALLRGYELWVRVKSTRARRKLNAERMENELLAKYDYAWNKRNNGNRVRNILPWVDHIKAT